MIKKLLNTATLLLVLTGLGSTPTQAQSGVNAPYSQYGIGLNNYPYGIPWAAAQGGVTYTQRGNTYINPFNPASYSSIEMQTFRFDMGMGLKSISLKDPNTSQYDADGYLAYINIGFPIRKWWKTAIGVMPYTGMDYSSVQTIRHPAWDTMNTIYEGYGSVNKLFWGHAFSVGNRLSVGFNANLLIGNLTRAITYDFINTDSIAFLDSRKQKTTHVCNLTFDFGAQYSLPVNEKHTLNMGLTLKLPQTMNVTDKALEYTYVTYSSVEYMRDTIFPTNGQSGEYTSTLKQPFTLGIGLAFERNELWQCAVDFTYAPWSGLKYTEQTDINLFGTSALAYDNNSRFNLAYIWMGNKESSHYYQRMGYSAGFHYEHGKLRLQSANIGDACINEWGFGVGVTFPMRKNSSALRISLDYSRMGSADILQHNAILLGVSIGSSDSWFVKRKYN